MTTTILFSAAMQYVFGPLILLTSLFLILVVLVQRGRGGGLTGALGGAGGQSAFGAKAGDVFTKITIVVAVFWILLCILATMSLQDQGTEKLKDGGSAAPATGLPADPGAGGPALTLPSEEGDAPAEGGAADTPAADLEPSGEGAADAPAPMGTAPAEPAPMDSAPMDSAAPAEGDAASTEEKPAE